MTGEGPYRSSAGESCPRCQAPLAPNTAGQPRACTSGCGEWAPADVVTTLWGDVIYTATAAARWWREDARGIDCPLCRQPMKPVPHDGWRVFRCAPHGAWLEPGVRARIEKHFAPEIALNTQVRELTAAIRDGDQAAIAGVVRRLLVLEHKLAMIELALDR